MEGQLDAAVLLGLGFVEHASGEIRHDGLARALASHSSDLTGWKTKRDKPIGNSACTLTGQVVVISPYAGIRNMPGDVDGLDVARGNGLDDRAEGIVGIRRQDGALQRRCFVKARRRKAGSRGLRKVPCFPAFCFQSFFARNVPVTLSVRRAS